MNYKLFVLNIISYTILYHIVFELLLTIYDFDEKSRISTPIIRLIRYYVFDQKYYDKFSVNDIYILIFNLLISSILLYFANKWYGKRNMAINFLKLVGIYIIINIPIIIYVIIDYSFATTFIYLLYVLIPMSIMTLLILPIFWINNKLFGKNNLEQ